VLVSGPPFSAFIAVAVAARRAGVPWVAEFRDRWADDRYTSIPGWRRRLDARVERLLVSRAAGIVTVSEPWAETFGSRYRASVATVMNGFDPAEFLPGDDAPEPGLPLRVLHLGTIYPERRDPGPLFQALKSGGFAPGEVRLIFYGSGLEWVGARSREWGADGFLETHAQVPRLQALKLQRQADILLLLQWNDPSEIGNVPAKLFEYLAARRPILGLGPLDGVPARLLRERRAGFFSNNAVELAVQVRLWVEQKRSEGKVPQSKASAYQGLSRDDQYRILERFLMLVAQRETSDQYRSRAAHRKVVNCCAKL
jgi:hypothetical protein